MSELQDMITRNLKIVMAVRGMDHRQDLAPVLGIHKDAVYNKFSGRRFWTLEDVAKLARHFRIAETELIVGVDPSSAAVASGEKSRYVYSPRRRSALVLTLPLVARPARQDSRPCPVLPLRPRRNRPVGSTGGFSHLIPNIPATERVNYA